MFKKNPLQKGQIVFLGDSIIQDGEWQSYFPNQSIANRGIAGDNTDGMLARLHEIIASKPKKIFFSGGINDISLQRNNEKIASQIIEIIRIIKTRSPETEIYIHSILPVNTEKLKYIHLKNKEGQIEDMNRRLEKLCEIEKIKYINIYSKFLSGKQQLNPDFSYDGLHINKKAYKIWSEYIRENIEH